MKSAPTLSITSWLKTHWILSALLVWQISSIFGQLGISAESTEPYLLFANFHSIKRINTDGSHLDTVFYSNTSNAVGVDYGLRQNYMFWTERERKVIMRSFLNGSNPTVLIAKDVGWSDDLAWDWINEKLYWTNPDNKTIEVYDPSSGYRRVLVELDQGSFPRAIVVDPSMGWLYWTDWGREPKIVRTSMDGNNSTVLHNTSLRWPNALTLDHESQTLYWIDGRLDRIETSNADGSDRKVLMNESISRPFAVSFFQNQLYWSDWSGNTIRTMSIQMPNSVAVVNQFNDLTQDPFGIEVVTAARQPREIANPCAVNNGGCTHLCLLSAVGEAGYGCVCPRGINTTECNNANTNVSPSATTTDNTPIPTSTVTLMVPEPESCTLLYVMVPVLVILFAIIVTLTIVTICRMTGRQANFKNAGDTCTSASYYSYPSPQTLPLHETADGDYIDPSAASPLCHNLTPKAANTEMGQTDEKKEVYQSLDSTSMDYTSLYMTTDMQGKSVAPTVQEGGREYVIVDKRKRDSPNLYATATSTNVNTMVVETT